jgi:hypothetical protein
MYEAKAKLLGGRKEHQTGARGAGFCCAGDISSSRIGLCAGGRRKF